ncbi:hypothetical protein [Cellulomonas sp. Marseille-Q8402]
MPRRDRSFDAIREDAVEALRSLAHPEPEVDVTRSRRRAAAALVEARGHFVTRDGTVDWSGRSHAYHAFVGELFSEANVPRELAPTIQASLRYHTGNLVRESVAEADLSAAGFQSRATPRERSAERRRRRGEAITLLESGGPLADDQVLRALALTLSVLNRLDARTLRALPPPDRDEAVTSLRQLARRAADLSA